MKLTRPDIQRIAGYIPGEQPQESGWIKLNTNENPYPPSPRVVQAVKAAAEGRLNIYPDPLATAFRQVAARKLGLDPDAILPANGSDENLTILTRTFVDAGELVASPYPSYILYETLAAIQGARHERLVLNKDWTFDLDSAEPIIRRSKLVFVPRPNSPSGNLWDNEVLQHLIPPRGILVLDEAYLDFADTSETQPHFPSEISMRVVRTRTLSKSYSLAGIRFGFAIADPALVAEMRKVKDSYNCNTLSLAAATAALEDEDWMRQNVERIRATRTRLSVRLEELGFQVVPSEANFVWATHPSGQHERIYQQLKERRILVRYMQFPQADPHLPGQRVDGLRITIGTDAEIDQFLEHLQAVL